MIRFVIVDADCANLSAVHLSLFDCKLGFCLCFILGETERFFVILCTFVITYALFFYIVLMDLNGKK